MEGYYNFTSALKLTLGGRYSVERKSLDAVNFDPAPLVFGSTGFTDVKTFKSFTPRAVLAYQTHVGNFYASFTKGFKSGGFNTPAFNPETAVSPEKIDSYEIGAKLKFVDGHLLLNIAGFHYIYKDLQVNITDFSRGGSFLENAGSARGNGAEVDVQIFPVHGLALAAGGAYLDAKYTNYKNAQVYEPAMSGVGLEATAVDLTGTRLPRAPRLTAYGSLSYDTDLGVNWTGNLSLVANYSSRFDYNAGAGGPLEYNRQKSYVLLNTTGYVSPHNSGVRLGFYIDNLTNAKYIANVDTTQYGLFKTFARPRTYGLRASYLF